jgi:ABC-2 type transport system ATP-binding protein
MIQQIITVKSLVKKYGDFTAVNDVSFAVGRGEILAFLGPNGAGKATTVEVPECLKTPTSGSVTIAGLDVHRDDMKIKMKIGVMPQSFNAFEWLTLWENINYFGQMYLQHASVDQLVAAFGLTEKRNVLFKNLSGGLKQRVGIAIALVNDPEILFPDEPTTGPDPVPAGTCGKRSKILRAMERPCS